MSRVNNFPLEWRHLETVLKQNGNQRKHGFLTHSEVNVAFASTHDQVRFGLGGCCVRGFRCRIIRA